MKSKVLYLMFLTMITPFLFSCENEDNDNEGENSQGEMFSSYNETESHNAGNNCMNCHKSGGSGEGIFTVGGTVYKTNSTTVYPNTTVKLYTGPNGSGTLVKTIEVDGKGNFYTSGTINFGSGLYPVVTGTTGSITNMTESIKTGACNSCHGVTTGKITAN
jgi:cytochrome c553